jgi:hypothetical protein
MDRPEYFILRVYRRGSGDAPELEGVVEVIATLEKQPFAGMDGLWAILRDSSVARQRSPVAKRAGDPS